MLSQVKKSLLLALCCDIGGVLACVIMNVYDTAWELFQFLVLDFVIAFALHFLLSLLTNKAETAASTKPKD